MDENLLYWAEGKETGVLVYAKKDSHNAVVSDVLLQPIVCIGNGKSIRFSLYP